VSFIESEYYESSHQPHPHRQCHQFLHSATPHFLIALNRTFPLGTQFLISYREFHTSGAMEGGFTIPFVTVPNLRPFTPAVMSDVTLQSNTLAAPCSSQRCSPHDSSLLHYITTRHNTSSTKRRLLPPTSLLKQ
jgi:hypothetical protein